MKIVANANFGMVGIVLRKMMKDLPIEIIELDFEPDGSFPKGKPDPLIEERRKETQDLIKKEKADLGVSWDADADRFFVFDEKGEFVDSYYLVGILAEHILKQNPKQKVIGDCRLIWAVRDTVEKAGGQYIVMKPGHAFIKDRMRQEDCLFAGENTGHFYYRDNFYADNGLIPFLQILEILSQSGQKMSALAKPYRKNYPVSGEINTKVKDKDKVIQEAEKKYNDGQIDHIDGVSVEYKDWRFNLRKSNTEPVIRLNVEAKSKRKVDKKVKELLEIIK